MSDLDLIVKMVPNYGYLAILQVDGVEVRRSWDYFMHPWEAWARVVNMAQEHTGQPMAAYSSETFPTRPSTDLQSEFERGLPGYRA